MKSYNGFSADVRDRAQAWLNKQFAAGRPRPAHCCACGQTEGIFDAHAEDYSEPFGEHLFDYPVCYRCHMMIHCRFRNPEAWDEYRAAVRIGVRFAALHTRNFGAIKAQLSGSPVALTRHEPPPRQVLDEIHVAAARTAGAGLPAEAMAIRPHPLA